MKKLVIAVIASAAVAMASSAFALQSMSADNMKDATAQAGVSIVVDDIILETWVGATSYTDTDGYLDGNAASVVIADKHTVQSFQAMTSFDGTALASPGLALTKTDLGALNYDVDGDGVADAYLAKALTIDVGTCPIYSAGATYDSGLAGGPAMTMTGVVIGLPTIEINTSSDTYTIGVDQAGADNDGAKFIQITTGAKTLHILGGTIEIAAH